MIDMDLALDAAVQKGSEILLSELVPKKPSHCQPQPQPQHQPQQKLLCKPPPRPRSEPVAKDAIDGVRLFILDQITQEEILFALLEGGDTANSFIARKNLRCSRAYLSLLIKTKFGVRINSSGKKLVWYVNSMIRRSQSYCPVIAEDIFLDLMIEHGNAHALVALLGIRVSTGWMVMQRILHEMGVHPEAIPAGMLSFVCARCGKTFLRKSYRVHTGVKWQQYCSTACFRSRAIPVSYSGASA